MNQLFKKEVFDVDEAEIVYQAKLKAKERLLAKHGQSERVLRAIREVAGV